MRLLASFFALLFALGPMGAQAEKADREKEIVIGADHLTADETRTVGQILERLAEHLDTPPRSTPT